VTRATIPLRRVLGLVEITAGGVGIIIGAGIYVLLGAATAEAGALVWIAFLAAAVLSLLSATVVAVIAVLTTTNTTLLALTAASRVTYGMARAGAMPPSFAIVTRGVRLPSRPSSPSAASRSPSPASATLR
jgi:amino acid transporter